MTPWSSGLSLTLVVHSTLTVRCLKSTSPQWRARNSPTLNPSSAKTAMERRRWSLAETHARMSRSRSSGSNTMIPPLTDFGGGGIAYRIRADQLFAKGIPKGYPQDCVEMVESEVTPSPVGILLIATRLSLTAE